MWMMLLHLHVNLNAADDDDFGPGATQTRLCSNNVLLETCNFGIRS